MTPASPTSTTPIEVCLVDAWGYASAVPGSRKWLSKPGILIPDSGLDRGMFIFRRRVIASCVCNCTGVEVVSRELGVQVDHVLAPPTTDRYRVATASETPGCQPPPSALKVATAARADSVCACARASAARSKFSSACKTSIRLTTPP